MNVIVQGPASRLLRSDWEILNDPQGWATDSILAYWLEVLEKRYSKLPSPRIVCFDPSTVFWILLETDAEDLTAGLSALRLEKQQMILFPINDSRDTQSALSGCHWSLLACFQTSHERLYYHFDSHNAGEDSLNYAQAELFRKKIETHLTSLRPTTKQSSLLSVPCGRQEDSSSCGFWLLLFAEYLMTWVQQRTRRCLSCTHLTQDDADALRHRIRQYILDFMPPDYHQLDTCGYRPNE